MKIECSSVNVKNKLNYFITNILMEFQKCK